MYTELTIEINNVVKMEILNTCFFLVSTSKVNILYNSICITGDNLRRPVAMLEHPEVNLVNLGGTREGLDK